MIMMMIIVELESKYSNWKFIFWKCGKVQISASNCNKYKDIRGKLNDEKKTLEICHYSFDKILSSRLLSMKFKVNIIKFWHFNMEI